MRLTCRLVRFALPWYEHVPGWIERHAVHCGCCRRETQAYKKMARALSSAQSDGLEPPSWDSVRETLAEAPPARPVAWKPVAAYVGLGMVIVLAALAAWLASPPSHKQKEGAGRQMATSARTAEPGTASRSTIPPDAPRLVNPVPKDRNPQPRLARQSGNKMAASQGHGLYHKMRSAPHRTHTPMRLKPKNVAPEQEWQPQPDRDQVAGVVIAPEEHVIKVVGVNTKETSGDQYVIRCIDPGDPNAGVPL